MSEQNPIPLGGAFTIVLPDAPELPLLHVNALNLRYSLDEFFFTLGVVLPPEVRTYEDVERVGTTLTAQPVFRFALSRETMAKFLELMNNQYRAQTTVIEFAAHEREGQQ
jgi:hypothetical protein